MARLSLDKLCKTYAGGVTAVQDASIEVEDGEFIVLVGPSGCGKSTTLRMIAGLERITSGTLKIGDRVVNEVEPGERDIAMVFQTYALYPHMTVRKNMAYGLKNEGLPKEEINQRIAEVAQTLRLSDLLDRKPRQLSGGQRQRVAMGRAIVRKPAAFLLDEPLSNLDAKLRTQLRAELKSLHRRLGTTFVYVTHDQVEAMSLADRIVVMNGGKIEQVGRPMEVYQGPLTRFVAEFIGNPAMNLLDGVVGADGLKLETQRGVLANVTRRLGEPGQKLTLGIRPEDLLPNVAGDVSLPLEPVFEEKLGADTLLHCRIEGIDEPTIVLRLGGSATIPVQSFVAAASAFHLFDPVSGARLQ